MRRIFIMVVTVIVFLFWPRIVSAEEIKIACPERFVTLVNPVRGRGLWVDKSISPLINQYNEIISYSLSASWLLQYDALADWGVYDELQSFNKDQEFGLFLEVTPNLASASRVIYPHMVAWDDPNAVFLSGYTQSERRKLIDTLFGEFKNKFGYFPRSVGAWWIDSYSLEYMVSKYNINTALIVADQKTTDDYGIWGQWWGVPYYPSPSNILMPSNSKGNNLVVVQWAQRDLTKAYGVGPSISNYSLQANDYTERRQNTEYFVSLANKYLDCSLPVGQITVGLETGMESVKSFPEYKNQLKALSQIEGIKSVTLKDFSLEFSKVYKSQNPKEIFISDNISTWKLSLSGRQNDYLGDKVGYSTNLAFSDYFVPDQSKFLDRRLPITHIPAKDLPRFIFPIFIFVLIYFLFWMIGYRKYFLQLSLLTVASYFPLLSSFHKFGWRVFYGPEVSDILVAQFLVVTLPMLFLFYFAKKFGSKIRNFRLMVYLASLSYGLDFLAGRLRYTSLSGVRYFGFSWDALRFIGLKFFEGGLSFVNQDFNAVIASSMLRVDFNSLNIHPLGFYVLYPLLHILLGVLLWLILRKLPRKIRLLAVALLTLLFCVYIHMIFSLNPRVVA